METAFKILERDYKKAHDRLMQKLSYQVLLSEAEYLLNFLKNKEPMSEWEASWHNNFFNWGMRVYRK